MLKMDFDHTLTDHFPVAAGRPSRMPVGPSLPLSGLGTDYLDLWANFAGRYDALGFDTTFRELVTHPLRRRGGYDILIEK